MKQTSLRKEDSKVGEVKGINPSSGLHVGTEMTAVESKDFAIFQGNTSLHNLRSKTHTERGDRQTFSCSHTGAGGGTEGLRDCSPPYFC